MQSPSSAALFARIAALAAIYAALVAMGLSLAPLDGVVAVISPSTGVALALLVLGGRRLWPAIFFGAVLANLLAGTRVPAALLIGAGNALEAWVGARLLERFVRDRHALDRLGDTALLALVVLLVAAPIGAIVATAALASSGVEPARLFTLARVWWTSSALSDVVLVPLILVWSRKDALRRPAGARVVELAIVAAALIGTTLYAFSRTATELLGSSQPLPALPRLWSAFRFQQRGSTLSTFGFVAIAFAEVMRGLGPFAHPMLSESIVSFNEFAIFGAVAFLFIGAAAGQRRDAEAALKQSEAKFQDLYDRAPDMFASVEAPAAVVVECNDTLCRALGYQRAELIGRTAFELHHADDLARFREAFEELMSAGEVRDVELSLLCKNGTFIAVSLSMSAIRDEAAKVIGGRAVWRNISDRKRTERSLRFLADAAVNTSELDDTRAALAQVAHSAVQTIADCCTIDLSADLAKVLAGERLSDKDRDEERLERIAAAHYDPAEEKLLFSGGARAESVISKLVVEALRSKQALGGYGESSSAGEISPALREAASRVMPARQRTPNWEAQLDGLDACAYVCVPLTAGERPFGAMTMISWRRFLDAADLALVSELAHRVSLAVENARLYREARSAVAIRDEFLSVAGHELKTPLTSMYLLSEMLVRDARRGAGVPVLEDKADRLLGNVRQLTRLVEQLLDVSRMKSGRFSIYREEIELARLVRELVERTADQFTSAGCTVKIIADKPVRGRWDRARLEQVVLNLLTNAMKYGAEKPIELEVRGTSELALLAVRDHGIGISPEFHDRIFERFERAVSQREFTGLGLGLWIAREIVVAHGGTIQVDSVPGEGATFTVTLPTGRASLSSGAS